MKRVQTTRDGREITIREAEGRDAADVIDHVHAVSGESDNLTFGPGEFEVTVEDEVGILESFRAAPNRLYLLAIVDGAIVGSLSFSASGRPRIRHTGEFGMSVRESHWGQGVGGAMLDALVDWARSTGIVTQINLRVRTDNVRAVALYSRKGFVLEGTISREFLIDGQYFDAHCMGLSL